LQLKNLIQQGPIPHIFRLFSAASIEIRLVGGCVRDAIQGIEIQDIDFAVCAPAEKTLEILTHNRIKTGTMGMAYGTISAFLPPFTVEITSLRQDVESYGRAAQVEFFDNMEENWLSDAKRRDFTINAMYVDAQGTLFDPFNGLKHLRQKRVVFIGNPQQRIQEDFLRILRYYRFGAYLTQRPMPSIPHINTLKQGLLVLSIERIQKELFKTLAAPMPLFALETMAQDGVLDILFPKIPLCFRALKRMIGSEIFLGRQAAVLTRLYAVFKGDIATIGQFFKLSRQQEQFLKNLHTAQGFSLKDVLYDFGAEIATEWLFLQQQDYETMGALSLEISSHQKPVFPLNGNDLLNLKVHKGPCLGKLLKTCEQWWRENHFTPDHQACLDYVVTHMKNKQ
jgi:poly(A) polymerase